MSPFPTETLEIDAQGRESLVLDVALPVLGAWAKSVRVTGFRPSMGVSGLSPREVARLRTLGLATGSRATGIFEGANDFRLGFPTDQGVSTTPPSFGVEADLGGHPLAPVVCDLSIAAFGLPSGKSVVHHLSGFTHLRAANAHGYAGRTLTALGREMGLDLKVTMREFGFEPQGLGVVEISALRTRSATSRSVDWKRPGDMRGIHVVIGAVRPRIEQMDRLEAEIREALWESRRVEPSVDKIVTQGVDLGAFLQVDVERAHGGATFMDVVGRSTPPLPLARRAIKKALAYWDSEASCDDVTGISAISAAVAAGGELELSLAPSERLAEALDLLRDLGARIDEAEAPGLVQLKTAAR